MENSNRCTMAKYVIFGVGLLLCGAMLAVDFQKCVLATRYHAKNRTAQFFQRSASQANSSSVRSNFFRAR